MFKIYRYVLKSMHADTNCIKIYGYFSQGPHSGHIATDLEINRKLLRLFSQFISFNIKV